MPNGFDGPDEEWERLESPLRALDPALDAFAREHALHVGRNYHNWPERSLTWNHGLSRVIQIYLADAEKLTWNLWLCASQDRKGSRYWKKTFLRQNVPLAEIASSLEALLAEAWNVTNAWRESDLAFATKLAT